MFWDKLRIERMLIWAVARENLSSSLQTTKAQTSLNSAFVIRLLESIISKLDTREILFFYVVSVAEQAGLNITLSETPKTGFVATRPI